MNMLTNLILSPGFTAFTTVAGLLSDAKELKLNDFQKAKEIVVKKRKCVELEVRDKNFPLKILDQLNINKAIIKKDKYTVLE